LFMGVKWKYPNGFGKGQVTKQPSVKWSQQEASQWANSTFHGGAN